MMAFWSGAAGAAAVSGIFAIIMWLLNRRAAKADKIAEQKEQQEKEIDRKRKEQWDSVREQLEAFLSEFGAIKADILTLKENDRIQDEERAKDKALDARRRIIDFADEVRRGVKHSLEHFNNILEDISYYNDYCHAHEAFKNEKAVRSIERIEHVYDQCMAENDFL